MLLWSNSKTIDNINHSFRITKPCQSMMLSVGLVIKKMLPLSNCFVCFGQLLGIASTRPAHLAIHFPPTVTQSLLVHQCLQDSERLSCVSIYLQWIDPDCLQLDRPQTLVVFLCDECSVYKTVIESVHCVTLWMWMSWSFVIKCLNLTE